MYQLSVLYRSPRGSLSRDIADEILERGLYGKIAVVTDKPVALLSATKKQWLKLARQAQRDRSSTLDASKVSALTQQIAWMQSLRFSATTPDDLLEAGVTFASAKDFVHVPPVCRTIYVTYEFEIEKLHILTSWMPRGGLVVIYGKK
ncbi:MAG TPA: hypothetical protein VFT16_05950 [Candidatus Saccharimonadales bacterium]|nr:hypothetical protein [Candidatus Saccharimonadales bacterium]